ncbi:hypothetical protein AHAS_AhasUnG0040800 [Arachis hypogaea]
MHVEVGERILLWERRLRPCNSSGGFCLRSRCFGGIAAAFSNFGSGYGSLGNVKADEIFEDTVAVVH